MFYMSSFFLGKDGYQTVLPCENALFPPGIYCPRPARRPLKANSAQQPKYVPLQQVNGMNYLFSRADISSSPPITRKNQVIVFSRKLGHMPLETLWNTCKCVSGLDFLANSHFPRNYISSDAMVGKMPHVDR